MGLGFGFSNNFWFMVMIGMAQVSEEQMINSLNKKPQWEGKKYFLERSAIK